MEISKYIAGLGQFDKTKVDKAAKTDENGNRTGSKSSSTGDRVSLSSEAKLRTEAHRAAQDAPDIRREKVEALKAQIAAGEYEIDSRKIAENLVKEDLDLLM